MSGIGDIWLFANNIIRSSRLLINEELAPLGLSSAEGNILFHLLTQNQAFRQEDIVEQLDISKPAVSRALKSLEVKGHILREKDPSDRRASRVLLTGKAREIGPRVERIYSKVYAIATQGVSDEEVNDFIDLFGRVSENFSTARAKEGSKRRKG